MPSEKSGHPSSFARTTATRPPPVYQGAALPLAIRGSPALSSDLSYGAVTTRFNTYSVNTSTNIRVGVMMPGGPAGRQFTVQRAEVSTLG
jgi:hypothetical protein